MLMIRSWILRISFDFSKKASTSAPGHRGCDPLEAVSGHSAPKWNQQMTALDDKSVLPVASPKKDAEAG
jgi:hypothetical protein